MGANFPGGLGLLPVKPGSCGKTVPGYDVQVLNDEGLPVPPDQIGNIAVKLPLPPGCFPTLWNNDAGYLESYIDPYPGYYKTADAGYKDEDGYLWIMSRTDDIINVAGHRLSTGALEEVLAAHADVAECAVIGVADELKGEVPLGLVVLKLGVTRAETQIVAELIQIVQRLPKTRSGKIVRGTIKKIADGVEYRMPPTIEDPAVIDEIKINLNAIGYPRQNGNT
jgi:propionyl-CoA synthetase